MLPSKDFTNTQNRESLLKKRAAHLEMMAAAFLKKTNIEADNAVLIEERQGSRIVWYYAKKDETETAQ